MLKVLDMNPETPTPNVVQPDQTGTTPTNNNTPPTTPPNQGWSPANAPTPPSSSSKTRRIVLIIAAVVLVLIVGLVLTKAMTGKKNSGSKATSLNSELYHNREGYNIDQYGVNIGDPLALNMDKLGEVHKSPTGPIIYACNVVSLKDLGNLKNYVEARNDDRSVMRNYIDSVGQASLTPNEYTLPGGDDGNTCNYSLQSGGLLQVSVYQTPFTTKYAIDHQLSRNFIKTDTIGGLTAYKDKDNAPNKRSSFMLLSGDTAVEILFNTNQMSDAKQKPILDLAAKNFASLQTTPQGPAIPVYDTPTYKKKYARACDLITNDDIKALTGADASPFVYEGLPSGTGVSKVNNKLYNSIETSCARYNTGLGSALAGNKFDHKLEVTIISHNYDIPAREIIANTAKEAKNTVEARIGDQGFGYKDSAEQNTVVFRQGRFSVQIVYDRTAQKNGLDNTASMVEKLTPFAQQLATRLKALQ